MNNLTKYVGISALVLGPYGCVKQFKKELPAERPQEANPCHEDQEGVYASICEFDRNNDGVIDEIVCWGKDGNIAKEVRGGTTKEFFRDEEGNLIRMVMKEGASTRVSEYEYGNLRKDSFDADSDGNPEDVFLYDLNGDVPCIGLYIGDMNSDGLRDSLHLFDAESRVIHLESDADLNGKFDTYIDLTRNKEGTIILETKGIDKDEDGYVDVIYSKYFDDKGNLVRRESDYNADGIADNVWYS